MQDTKTERCEAMQSSSRQPISTGSLCQEARSRKVQHIPEAVKGCLKSRDRQSPYCSAKLLTESRCKPAASIFAPKHTLKQAAPTTVHSFHRGASLRAKPLVSHRRWPVVQQQTCPSSALSAPRTQSNLDRLPRETGKHLPRLQGFHDKRPGKTRVHHGIMPPKPQNINRSSCNQPTEASHGSASRITAQLQQQNHHEYD